MFELSTALTYVIPRKGRLSQAVTTLIAVLVISTIVWLSLVYFSTIAHIEERWTSKIQGVTGTYELLPKEGYFLDPSSQIDQRSSHFSYTIPRLSLHQQTLFPSWDSEQDGSLEPHLQQALTTPIPLFRLIDLLNKQKPPFSFHLFEQHVAHARMETRKGEISQYVMIRGASNISALSPMMSRMNELDSIECSNFLRLLNDYTTLERAFDTQPLTLTLTMPKPLLLVSSFDENQLFHFKDPKTNQLYSIREILRKGKKLHFTNATPCLLANSKELYPITNLGYPVLLPIQMKKQGLKLGDRIILESAQEDNKEGLSSLKSFVAGFFDPGILPIGSKLLISSSEVVTTLFPPLLIDEPISSSGIVIDNPGSLTKEKLENELKNNHLDDLFLIRAYDEAPMTKEVFDQLKNEHTLFQLLSSIFLFVASSNILSMLFLIARDRKKELALFRALGLKRKRICLLFTTAGFLTGFFSLLLGILLASCTLHFLPECLSLISWAQGRAVLDPTIFGAIGPSVINLSSLLFCSFFVLASSTIAGLGASLYATRISISEALKEP